MKGLGIDLGTTTISMAVWNIEAERVEKSYAIENGSFHKECESWEKVQDPERIIARAMELLEQVLEEYPEIQVLGLTGQMHGILYLDEDGNAISPLYTWQDQRGEVRAFAGKSICELTEETVGYKVPTGYGLISHLYNEKQKLVPAETMQICTIMDYLGMKLTGRKRPLTHSSNAASMGFFDVERGCFRIKDLEKLGIYPDILPEVTEEFVLLGEYRGIPVGAAIGDNQASFLGSVKDTEEAILVNMGTGGQISVLSDRYFSGNEIEARPFSKGVYLLAGASLCGGRAYASLARFFLLTAEALGLEESDPYKLMDQLLKESILKEKNCGEPLKVTTAFSGTRREPQKRGVIENITEDNLRPDALTYGVLEGMAQELYEMYQEIKEGLPISRKKMIASGNALRKNVWLQEIMSQKFQMELQLAENAEEAACGAVVCAALAAKLFRK